MSCTTIHGQKWFWTFFSHHDQRSFFSDRSEIFTWKIKEIFGIKKMLEIKRIQQTA